ncbi:PP2C family protein-serine/threonine phosphatase [Streptomyces lancefieldiae]|uniref:PP2C family protein-serine/threonine phosphatase n=1 Tax=Streptomyces lancefieldiae TaxID=3075520 RepID=A0ABU3AGJ7_9ACTN|nr:PP2C family protein-serine/threonine phosphatase [Streptomyces sp. DSM 40712]MDT0609311.1 PP2C family protein-serine/threonine phosphatase [Streptomyces sp. DSM 40712]
MSTSEASDALLLRFLADPAHLTLDLAAAVAHCAKALDLPHAVVYLVDLQQRHLIPQTDAASALPVDGSLAGWAYRSQSLRVEESGTGGVTAWLPLLDGAERLGVLAVHASALTGATLTRSRALASLLAIMISSKRAFEDSLVRHTRTEQMRLPSEMLRAFLPPRTIGNAHVVSTAVLEPAYEIGGDAFDHSLTRTTLHVAVIDSMGHDLASGLTSAVALAACRNARRNGADLPELVESVDDALARWLPDRYCTAVIAQLEFETGLLRWSNCGHPAPLLIRGEQLLVDALAREADPPMGVPVRLSPEPRRTHETRLEPGDRVLLYTDGVTEAHTREEKLFGLERFADYVIRATAGGELAPEALRRLIHSILDSQTGRLRDDATILMFEWRPPIR